MYTELAQRHVIRQVEVSRAVEMSRANAVLVEATVFHIGTTSILSFLLQVSNDLANWTFDFSGFASATAVGYHAFAISDIAARYVRVVYAPASAGTAVVATGIHIAKL